MPKAASDGVQTIRFEFQDSERQMFRDFIAGQNVVAVGKTIDDLLSFENLYIGATIYEMITGEEVLAGTPNDLGDLLSMVIDWYRKKKAEYGDNDPFAGNLAQDFAGFLSDLTGLDEGSWFAGLLSKNERVSDFTL